jgi:2'-5' RNA ligase
MPDPACHALIDARAAILDADPSWAGEKWVDADNLHVTALFLGEVADSGLRDAAAAALRAVADMTPYALAIDRVTATPSPRAASMLWAAPSAEDAATYDLASRLASACSPQRTPTCDHRFATHVTLCRTRKRRRISPQALALASTALRTQDRSTTVSVGEVTLFTSTLTRRGPVYEQYAVVPFGG